jgi:hypothetical protein
LRTTQAGYVLIRVVERILVSNARNAFSVGPITVGKGRASVMFFSYDVGYAKNVLVTPR